MMVRTFLKIMRQLEEVESRCGMGFTVQTVWGAADKSARWGEQSAAAQMPPSLMLRE